MGNYVLTFRAPKGRVPTAEEEARWPQWFEKIGGRARRISLLGTDRLG